MTALVEAAREMLGWLDVARVRTLVAAFAELKEDSELGRPFEEALSKAAPERR